MKQKRLLRKPKPKKIESPMKAAEKSDAQPQQDPLIAPFIQRIEDDQLALTPENVQIIQKIHGNRYASRLAEGRPVIQAKLTVGPANDAYEQEADTAAANAMIHLQRQEDTIQREPEEEEELVQGMFLQREAEEEEELLQGKFLQRDIDEEEELQAKLDDDALGGTSVGADVESQINSAKGGGKPLADGVRGSMEGAFGADFSGVRVHDNAHSDNLNRSVQAKAFTTGSDIFFSKGTYNPGSSTGQKLLAHELTHTIQQGASIQREDTVQRQVEPGTIQRMPPTQAGAIRAGGAAKGKKIFGMGLSKTTRSYEAFLSKLNTLDQFTAGTLIAPDRAGIIAQFKRLREMFQDIADAGLKYCSNSSNAGDRHLYVLNVATTTMKEAKLLGMVMVQELDKMSWRQANRNYPSLQQVVIAGLNRAGRSIQVSKSDRTGTAGGGMNQVGFYNEGVFKSPHLSLGDDVLGNQDDFFKADQDIANMVGNDPNATTDDARQKLTGKYQNEHDIAGGKLGLRHDDSLINREVAMSYLDRLLGAGMLARAEKALEQDGVKKTKGVIAEQLTPNTFKNYMGNIGDLSASNNASKKQAMTTNTMMQGLSKLQLLDMLALQVDRHAGNYMVETDASGNIIKVIGFDHDMSFGRKMIGSQQSQMKEIPGLAKYVDAKLAQAIIDLDPEVLRMVMEGLLEPDVIEWLLARLEQLQAHLLENQATWLQPNQWVKFADEVQADKSYYGGLVEQIGTRL